MGKFKTQYQIDDGYVGGDRPQHIIINEWDVIDVETEEQAESLIEEIIQQHFLERITPYMKEREREAALAWIMSQVEERKRKEEEEGHA